MEQESVHVMRHVEPPAHETLPLGPRVISHVEPPAQLTVQEAPHEPLHWFSLMQASEQLSPSHAVSSVLHASPASQAHDDPLHSGGAMSSPQPGSRPTRRIEAKSRWRIWDFPFETAFLENGAWRRLRGTVSKGFLEAVPLTQPGPCRLERAVSKVGWLRNLLLEAGYEAVCHR